MANTATGKTFAQYQNWKEFIYARVM